MFSPTSFAPLYAERFLEDSKDPVSAENQDRRKTFDNRTQTSPFQQFPRVSSKGSDSSPTTTESSSDDFPVMEEKFEDEIYVRPMSSSGVSQYLNASNSSMNPSVRRFTGRPDSQASGLRASKHDEQQLHAPRDDFAQRDRQMQKLMKKLDKMQRRVVDLKGHDLQLQRAMAGDDKLGMDVAPLESFVISDEEKQQEESTKKEFPTQPPLGPEAKRLIHKLLNDYEHMEKMYKEEKLQHALALQSMSLSQRRTVDAEGMSQVSTNLDPAWDNQASVGVFRPKLQDAMRFSHIRQPPVFHSSSGLSSLAPDPPEFVPQQRDYVDSKLRVYDGQHQYHSSKVSNDDDTDRHSDDLSSRHVNSLIDDDVDSQCNAIKDHNEGRQYMRDIILGVNDGLVSTFLLVAGVRGGGMSTEDILLTAIAGSVAGAVSMCAGEFVATKSQNEVTKGEIATEERHIKEYRMQELTEVSDLLELIGIGGEDRSLQKRLIRHYARDPKALLKIMIALELGFLEEEERSPLMAGFVSFWLFLMGATPSVIPFMIPDIDPTAGFIAAGVATCVTLLLVGAVKTWATKGSCFLAAVENLCVAGFGGAVAYGAGYLARTLIE